jgi:hypothetical protein
MAQSTFPTTTTSSSHPSHSSRPTTNHRPTPSLDLQPPLLDDEMIASYIRSPSVGGREAETSHTTVSSTSTSGIDPLPPNQQARRAGAIEDMAGNKSPPSSPMASQMQPPTIDSYNSPTNRTSSTPIEQSQPHLPILPIEPVHGIHGAFSSPSNLFRPSSNPSSEPATPSATSFNQNHQKQSPGSNPIGLGIGVIGSKRKFSGGGEQVEIAKKAMKFSFGGSS